MSIKPSFFHLRNSARTARGPRLRAAGYAGQRKNSAGLRARGFRAGPRPSLKAPKEEEEEKRKHIRRLRFSQ